MKIIHSLTVATVVLMVTLSMFAGTAAAAHELKDTDHEIGVVAPGDEKTSTEDRFLKAKKAFNGNENFPDSTFDKKKNFPDSAFGGNENFPDSTFDNLPNGEDIEEIASAGGKIPGGF